MPRKISIFKRNPWDTWVAPLVEHVSLAQVMIPGSWDPAPSQAPCSEGSLLFLLPLPLLRGLHLSLTLSQINKMFKKKIKEIVVSIALPKDKAPGKYTLHIC